MAAGVVHYRTKAGGADFTFRFAWIPQQKTWRVYIEQQPSYGSRKTGAHESHRLGLPNAPYVCWTKPLPTYLEARSVAALWADATQLYIANGTFPPPARDTGHVQDRSPLARHNEEQLRAALTEGGASKVSPTPRRDFRNPFRGLLERIG